MSKLEAVLESCKTQMKKQRISCDAVLLEKIAKSLGPSIYNRDARTVAAGQKSELDAIKKNFLAKKLGMAKDDPKMDKVIAKAIKKIGSSNRAKLRPVFYYILVKELKKESVYK